MFLPGTDPFDTAYLVLIGHEGALSFVREDPGNWTGGAVGRGELRGTKYGISAASFPTLDIPALTLAQAKAIYRALYWVKAGCPGLPAPLALLVFDAAVNTGVGRAARLLQASVGAVEDGLVGTGTMAAVARAVGAAGLDGACAEFQARRMVFMADLDTWPTFGLGWARRLCRLPFQAARLFPANPASEAA